VFLPQMQKEFNLSHTDIKNFGVKEMLDYTEAYKAIYHK
jgi:hypothetical protein